MLHVCMQRTDYEFNFTYDFYELLHFVLYVSLNKKHMLYNTFQSSFIM